MNRIRVLIGLVLLFLISGLFVTLNQLRQEQDPRSKAAGKAVTFTITPQSQNVIIGDDATFDIALATQVNKTTGVDITLGFDPTRIESAIWQTGAHNFSTILNNGVISTSAGTIKFTIININPTTISSTIPLGRVILKTKLLGTGNLSMTNAQVTSSIKDTTLPVNPTTPGSYTVNPVPTSTPVPTNTPIPTPTITPTHTPIPPTATPTNTPPPTPTNTPTPTITPLIGDFTKDFVVDLLDFNLWKVEYLSELTSKNSDANGDGIIDLVDFNLWLNTFRAT